MESVLEQIQGRSDTEILVRNLLPKASAVAGAVIGNEAVSKKIATLEDRRDKAKTKYEKDLISKQIRRLQVAGVLAGGAIGGVGAHYGTKLAYGDYRDKTPTWTPRVPGPKPEKDPVWDAQKNAAKVPTQPLLRTAADALKKWKARGYPGLEEAEFSSDAVNAMASHGSRLRNRGIYGALGGAALGAGISAYATRKKIAALKQKIETEKNPEKKAQFKKQLRLLYAASVGATAAGAGAGAMVGRKSANMQYDSAMNKEMIRLMKDYNSPEEQQKRTAERDNVVNRMIEDLKRPK